MRLVYCSTVNVAGEIRDLLTSLYAHFYTNSTAYLRNFIYLRRHFLW